MLSRRQFDWCKYLELAQQLATDIQEMHGEVNEEIADVYLKEAKLRSSVSRAYYAAFCKAREYLRDIEQDSRLRHSNHGSQIHRYVIDDLMGRKEKKDKNLKSAGDKLDRLRALRNESDYDDLCPNLSKKVGWALESASQIIFLLDKHINQ